MSERDINAGQLEHLGNLASLLCSLLVGSNLGTVGLDLGRGRDQRDEQPEPLPERLDVVVDLKENIVLNPLRETNASHVCVSLALASVMPTKDSSQDISLDVGRVKRRQIGGHRGYLYGEHAMSWVERLRL